MSVGGSCHCGAVSFEVARAPDMVTSCACSICRRYAALWAYYAPREVSVSGETDLYVWGDRDIEFHRCRRCGCVTHWAPANKGLERMAVNARLMEPAVVEAARLRRIEGPTG